MVSSGKVAAGNFLLACFIANRVIVWPLHFSTGLAGATIEAIPNGPLC